MLHFSPEKDRNLAKQLHQLNSDINFEMACLIELPPPELDAIHQSAKISMIGASTRIENAVLTNPEVRWLDTFLSQEGKKTAFKEKKKFIINKLLKERERSIEEVAGCRVMLNIIYDQAKSLFPLTEATIKGLHRELLQEYPPAKHHLGHYKKQPNQVVERNHKTGEERIVFDPAPPGPRTETAMHELVKWYNESIEIEPWSVAVASEFVFRFLAIHPFQDGNGRLGRGLFLLALLQSPQGPLSQIARYLAIDRQIERHKEDYYLVLNQGSGGKFLADPSQYQLQYYLHFMVKVMLESIQDVEIYRNRYTKIRNLSSSGHKVFKCFDDKPEIKLSTKNIIEITLLPRRTVSYALKQLAKDQLIQKYGKGAGVHYQLIF